MKLKQSTMASIAISASSLQRACSSKHVVKKQHQSQTKTARSSQSLGTKQDSHIVPLNVDGQRSSNVLQQPEKSSLHTDSQKTSADDELDTQSSSAVKFTDARWKKGTWDLNMFVKDGRMDWNAVIVAGQSKQNMNQ